MPTESRSPGGYAGGFDFGTPLFGGDAGCRSKLVASCNAEKLLENWAPMWHRVTVFGDYRRDFINLFRLKGMDIIEEDR